MTVEDGKNCSRRFENKISSYLIAAGHTRVKIRTFKLSVPMDQLECFLYLNRETGLFSGYFSAEIGVRSYPAVRFAWHAIEKFAPLCAKGTQIDLKVECFLRWSTARLERLNPLDFAPGMPTPALFNSATSAIELRRFRSVIENDWLPIIGQIKGVEAWYEILIAKEADEWYGKDLYREPSLISAMVVALGRILSYSEQKIISDVHEILRPFEGSMVGRANPKMDGQTFVKLMYSEWDNFLGLN